MKKTLLSLVLMLFMAFSLVLTGCSEEGLSNNPNTNELVISNGGMTVVKGDYLYYINGYVDETKLDDEEDNEFGEVTAGAIYRTKLVNGNIVKDKDGFVVSTECVVPKVVGFSNGGFYIVDDYIYYTTPNMNYSTEDGSIQTSRVEFHKIKIDGTEDETIYSPEASESKLDWTIYKVDGKVYIATYVDSKITIINPEDDEDIVEVEDSTSYAFYDEEVYNANKSRDLDTQKYIYFTRSIDTTNKMYLNHKGNEVCKLNVATGDIEVLVTSDTYIYSIVKVNDRNVYFTKQNGKTKGLTLMYRKEAKDKWNTLEEVKMSNVAYNNYYICDIGDDLMIATSTDEGSQGVYIVEGGVSTRVLDTAQTIVKVNGGYAYYLSENKLFRFAINGNTTGGNIETQQVTDVENTYLITNENFFDFDSQRIFVYRTYTSQKDTTANYMVYIDGELTEKFVGVFKEEDKPAKPEQHEDYVEGSDNGVEYTPWID